MHPSLKISHAQGYHVVMASALEQLAVGMPANHKDYDTATQLFGAAAAVRQTFHIPVIAMEKRHVEVTIRTMQQALGERRFDEIWETGRAMPIEEACAVALER